MSVGDEVRVRDTCRAWGGHRGTVVALAWLVGEVADVCVQFDGGREPLWFAPADLEAA